MSLPSSWETTLIQVACTAVRASLPFFIFGLSSCATMTLSGFPEPPSTEFRPVLSHPSISIFVKPIVDAERSREYFGVDLAENGILPVYVAIRSSDPKDSLLFSVDTVHIAQATAGHSLNDPERSDKAAGEILGGAGMVLISPLLAFAASQQFSDASVVKENFERVRLRSAMIEYGKPVAGFAYFDAKKLKSIAGGAEICWTFENTQRHDSLPVCSPLPFGG